jgi:hypothetical protein
MIKVYENQFSNNPPRQFSQTERDNKENPKLLLNHFKNKNASSFVQSKAIKNEYNIFKSNSNYLKRSNISDYNFKNNNQIVKSNTKKKFLRRISLMPESNYSKNNNIFASNVNLKKSFRLKEKKKTNDGQFLPKIDNDNASKRIKKDNSFKIKNNKMEQLKDKQKNTKPRTNSVFIPKVQTYQKSTKNVKKMVQKELILSPYAPKRKFKKMHTDLNLHSDLKMSLQDKTNRKYEENGDNKGNKVYENQELLYSQKFNNFILKIYKTSDSQSQSQQKQQKPEEKRFINQKQIKKKKSKAPKFTIKDYLNSFDPEKYIKNLKDKQLNNNDGELNEIKNKTLEKTKAYIEYFVFKKNKSQKKKKDILEKIEEKNEQLMIKYKKVFIRSITNEILHKSNIKNKKIINEIFMNVLSIRNDINFHIYIKLNIMRHVLTKSEKDENLYFFNLIKHFLYSGANKKYMIRYPFIKCYGEYCNPLIKKIKTICKFVESNNKKMYYRFFSIKFQQYDSETILNKYDENDKIVPKNGNKDRIKTIGNKNNESLRDDSDKFSTIENRIMMRQKTRKSTILFKYKNLSSSKLMKINLTKSIISLRGTKFGDILKNKNSTNLKLINAKFKQKNNSIKEDKSESSDSYEYNNNIKSYRNNNNRKLSNNNKIYENKEQKLENNEDIHQRDRKLLFEHFISCVEFSEYDKLYYWLKKSGKYIDLNYKFKNGDTLLHLCVRHSVPHYLIKYLIINGININGQNNEGDTALHLAAKSHKYKTIDLLIKLGASEYIYNNQKKYCWECL